MIHFIAVFLSSMLAVAKDLDAVEYFVYYPGHGTVGCCADSRNSVADGHINAYLQQQKMIFIAGISEAECCLVYWKKINNMMQ